MQTLIALTGAQIRRDAQTTTPVTVLAHELPLLYDLYGRENVAVDEATGRTHPVEADGEYQRLANKYGIALVEEVYGRESSGRLADALTRAAVTESNDDDADAGVDGPAPKRRGRRAAPPVSPEPPEQTESQAG